jgi:hypothetical protein
VAVSAGIVCAAVSLTLSLFVAHELEANVYWLVAFVAIGGDFFGVNRLLRRGLK